MTSGSQRVIAANDTADARAPAPRQEYIKPTLITYGRLAEADPQRIAFDAAGEVDLEKIRQSGASRGRSLSGLRSFSLVQRVAELERRLASANEPPSAGEVSDEALAVVAARIYQSRLRRGRHLPCEVLGEPGWEILLDLFVAAVRGKAVRTCSASIASQSPLTTGLRWLALLETRGLVERHTEFGDHRVKLVRLSREGFKAMRAYLLAGLAAGEL